MSGPARPDRQRPQVEVADILRDHAGGLSLSLPQARAVRSLVACRTQALGGHLELCDACGYSRPAYNSCRNRHCPKCQGLKQELWAEAQVQRLLPVPYFHIVFTVPSHLHPFFRSAPRTCLGLLFEAASETLVEVARRRLGVRIGLSAVLHTWTQKLLFHPHLHCVCPGGGLAPDAPEWVASGERFFLPVRVLRVVFRAKLLSKLDKALTQGELPLSEDTAKPLLSKASKATWVVYAKRPLAGPEQVLRYFSRYTHRIAISNSRLLAYDGNQVSLAWRDRADGNRKKELTLDGPDFARRFLQHMLPPGFVRIRHYGLLANRSVRDLKRARRLLGGGETKALRPQGEAAEDWVASFQRIFGTDPLSCPACRKGRLTLHLAFSIAGQTQQPTSLRAPP